MMNRRRFLVSLSAATAAVGGAYAWQHDSKPLPPLPPGEILGASNTIGHRLRRMEFPEPAETLKTPIVIIGGGIAGLSAGWKLQKSGFTDFVILELEAEVGGNSRSGQNAISAYPWGAHYLPFPTQECRAVRELLADFGILQGDPYASAPVYAERHINFAPQERLYAHGVWHDRLWPQVGVSQRDMDQYHRFQDLMDRFQRRRGSDGRKAFAIPIDFSASDPELLALDRMSMRDFLLQNGLDSEPLHWYVNYACRDDYGCRYDDTSAWIGIHYFASRDALAHNAESDDVLTWPEGNGWLVKQLRERLAAHLLPNNIAWRVSELDRAVLIDAYQTEEKRSVRRLAKTVIWAAPVFQAPLVFREMKPDLATAISAFEYAPWLVANLSLRGFPIERRGASLSWDNVLYDSNSLGYVVATHQQLALHQEQTVFTWYNALSDGSPDAERRRLLKTPWATWAEQILAELSRPHPDIRQQTTRLDLIRWGHAMVRPRTGFIWSQARQQLLQNQDRILFAHSDLSGYSVFEEANYHGVLAAEQALTALDIPFASSVQA